MQPKRLTKTEVSDFTCPPNKQQAFLWDSVAPRLAVRATARSTHKSFVFEGKLNRQTIRRTIGDTRNWAIEDARKEARRLQALLDQGVDPREQDRERADARAAVIVARETAKRQAESRRRYTLRALCFAYSSLLESRGKSQTGAQTRSVFKCHVFEPHPEIADTPAREVTSQQIATMVRHVAETGKDRTAGILRSYLSAAFNAARKAPLDAKLPSELIAYGVESNPVEPVSTIAIHRGDRTLTADELRAYMAALTEDLTDTALKVALFSGGQRMAQLLRAKVGDYDPYTRTLRLWDSKGRRTSAREHLLPLAPTAAALISKLIERSKLLETQLLFSSYGKIQLVDTTPGKRTAAICKTMSCDPFDLRDIRRTCETMLAGIGISRDTRAQLLSHGLSGVQAAHYDRHTYAEEKRSALVAWEHRLDDIAQGRA